MSDVDESVETKVLKPELSSQARSLLSRVRGRSLAPSEVGVTVAWALLSACPVSLIGGNLV